MDISDSSLKWYLYITFKISQDHYALDVKNINGLMHARGMKHHGELPTHIKGIYNLHGQIIPILDLNYILGYNYNEPDKFNAIILIEYPVKIRNKNPDNPVEISTKLQMGLL